MGTHIYLTHVSQDDLHTGRGGSRYLRYYNIRLSTYDKKQNSRPPIGYDMICVAAAYTRHNNI